LAVAVEPTVSVAVTLKLKLPAVVGVPARVSWLLFGVRVSPGGTVPEVVKLI
jgi:hypothetical protein